MTATPLSTQNLQFAAAAFRHAGDALIGIDLQGDIVLWNEHCTKLFGFTADDALGRSIDIIIPEKLRAAHWRGFNAAMASGHLASDGKARRTKALTADGGFTYATMTFAVVKDEQGETIGSVAVAREWIREG